MTSARAEQQTRRVAIIGASLAANKGAASMLWGVMDALPQAVGRCRITVLSTRREPSSGARDGSFE